MTRLACYDGEGVAYQVHEVGHWDSTSYPYLIKADCRCMLADCSVTLFYRKHQKMLEDYVPKGDYDPENLPEHHRFSYKRRITAILSLGFRSDHVGTIVVFEAS